MNIKTIILILFAIIACVSCKQETPADRPPNILFAIADDASWQHFGAYGCNWVKTPAFDRVANAGILFTRAYTPNAKCAPSRSCILTGRNSWQLEDAANHVPYFPKKFKTYAEALGENGYWVGSVAKGWAPGVPGKINGKERQLTGPKFDKYQLIPPTNFMSANDYARNFEDFLEARPDEKPFCFWYGCSEPHRRYEFESGINKGGKTIDEIDNVPAIWPDVDTIRKDLLDYAYEIEYFDSHLQKMLQKLEDIGELENTIVIVTADNGMPFPRIKGQVYEYSNHLPLAIMWPKGIKNPGRIVDDFVNFIDFAPTYMELAGLSAKEIGMEQVTGKSLTDIFFSEDSGNAFPHRDFVLLGKERHDVGRPNDMGYPVRGIIKGDFLYLRNFKTERWPVGNPETGYLNCDGSPTKTYLLNTRRNKRQMDYWKLNFGKRVSEEMYNIKTDPFCMNNLAGDESLKELKSEMSNEMNQKLTEQKDPRILDNGEIFDNYTYAFDDRDYYNRYMGGEKIPAGWVNKSDYDAYLIGEIVIEKNK